MEWSRLKNITLLILLMTNVCLLVFAVQRTYDRTQRERMARSDAIAFLQRSGVAVDETVVPQENSLKPQFAERKLPVEQKQAQRLLGGAVQVQAHGGEIYHYSNENGTLQLHSDGSFSAEFTAGAFPVGADAPAACISLLDALDYQAQFTHQQGEWLYFSLQMDNWPLFTRGVAVQVVQGDIVAMSGGRRLTGAPVPDESRQTLSVATALAELGNGIRALGDVCRGIDQLEQGYILGMNLSGNMILTPVWRVSTDTGYYQLELVSGTLTRIDK